MLTKEIAISTAQSFIADIKKLGFNPSAAYLFGSSVSNTAKEFSDIDLALWDKSFSGALHLDYEKVKTVLAKYKNIELHTYNSSQDESSNPFIDIIKKTGLKIVS